MGQADVEDLSVSFVGRVITNLRMRYSDDTALLTDNLTSMERILHRIDTAWQQAGPYLNAQKTKFMH